MENFVFKNILLQPSLKRHFATLETRRNWSRNASRSCFWDRYWGHAGQLLDRYFFSSLVTAPEVFAKVNSAQFPSRF